MLRMLDGSRTSAQERSKILLHKQRALNKPGADRKLAFLRKRLRSVTRRHERATKRQRFYRALRWPVMIAIAVGLSCWGFANYKHWPFLTAIRHLTAFPNCYAARAVGLAPSREGQPGYWPQHDTDNDKVACELAPSS